LKERLRPAVPVDARQVDRLIADLDRQVREDKPQAAAAELARLGESAEAGIRKALEGKPRLHLRARNTLLGLLKRSEGGQRRPEERQALRGVEALEEADTPEARTLLRELAGGAPEARLTREAQAALKRLTQKKGKR